MMRSDVLKSALVFGLAMLGLTVLGADVQRYTISKGLHYRQLPDRFPTNLAERGFVFRATVSMTEPGAVFDATIASREGTVRMLQAESDRELRFEHFLNTRQNLENRYPNGNFTFTFDTRNDGHLVVRLPLTRALYPPAPFVH